MLYALAQATYFSTLNFVDLAGSERASKTGAEVRLEIDYCILHWTSCGSACARRLPKRPPRTSWKSISVELSEGERSVLPLSRQGIRHKEGCHINRSLLALGTVIRKLAAGAAGVRARPPAAPPLLVLFSCVIAASSPAPECSHATRWAAMLAAPQAHVPYRDSKLTRLLAHSLGGNAKTAVVCCLSPAASALEQSRATLLFASHAKRVVNCAEANAVVDDKTLIREYQAEIAGLRAQLARALAERAEAGGRQSETTEATNAALMARLAALEKFILCAPRPEAAPVTQSADHPAVLSRRRRSWSPERASWPTPKAKFPRLAGASNVPEKVRRRSAQHRPAARRAPGAGHGDKA